MMESVHYLRVESDDNLSSPQQRDATSHAEGLDRGVATPAGACNQRVHPRRLAFTLAHATAHILPLGESACTRRNRRDCSAGFSIGINVDPSLSPLIL